MIHGTSISTLASNSHPFIQRERRESGKTGGRKNEEIDDADVVAAVSVLPLDHLVSAPI